MEYLALIRGINVGGNSLVKMAVLKAALERDGFQNVRTFIQSGNVLFDGGSVDTAKLRTQFAHILDTQFGVSADAVVFTGAEWHAVMDRAPEWWGKDNKRKHNLFILLPPYDMANIVQAIGGLNPDIEIIEPGAGVLYQSMSRELIGRTTTSGLAKGSFAKRITVRNYNTAVKLLALMK